MKGVREPRYFRRLFLALAALFAATAAMAIVGIFSGEESRELSAGALESFRAGLSDVFSPVRLAFAPGEDPYGGALEASAADRVTLGSAGLDQIPAEERTVTALYYGGPGNGRRAVYEEEISPSGARLTRRTGPFGWEITELPPDENRRVWLDNLSVQSGNILYVYAMAVYYDGGNPEVESLLERLFGEPVADGREVDPPAPDGSLASRWDWFIQWGHAEDYIGCAVLLLAAAVFLILALRPDKMDPAAASDWFLRRMEKAGVPLAPCGAVTEGPFGRLPGEEAFHAWLPAYSAGDVRRGLREAERQAPYAFPENLLAASLFPSARAAKKAAGTVAPSGDRLRAGGRAPLGYAIRRGVYRREAMVVYYAGRDDRVFAAVEKVCGRPFAGTGVKGRNGKEADR